MMPVAQQVANDYHELERLPLDREFSSRDVDIHSHTLQKWHHQEILTRVRRKDVGQKWLNIYRVTPRARREIIAYAPEWTLPCGHRGFVNLDGGQTFTCAFDECDATFGREVVKRALGRETEGEPAEAEGEAVSV